MVIQALSAIVAKKLLRYKWTSDNWTLFSSLFGRFVVWHGHGLAHHPRHLSYMLIQMLYKISSSLFFSISTRMRNSKTNFVRSEGCSKKLLTPFCKASWRLLAGDSLSHHKFNFLLSLLKIKTFLNIYLVDSKWYYIILKLFSKWSPLLIFVGKI